MSVYDITRQQIRTTRRFEPGMEESRCEIESSLSFKSELLAGAADGRNVVATSLESQTPLKVRDLFLGGRGSLTVFIVFVFGNLITWRLQTVNSVATCENHLAEIPLWNYEH